jgi:capsular polysaccharide transport system permease protein
MPHPVSHSQTRSVSAQRNFRTVRAIAALILREMATRYGRSPGGYVWALLEPLGGILILSFAFSLLLRTPSLGNSFILFYATGFMPFTLYQDVSSHVARAISFSRSLLFYPAVTWVDALSARFLLNTLTGLLVALILLTSISSLADTRTVIDILPILKGMILAILLAAGIGVLNCALFGLFPVWIQVWSIATRPLFLISGIFYLYEDMPRAVQTILWWNPLVHVIGLVREGFYANYRADYVNEVFVILVALITLALGVILLGRYHRDILNNG